MHIVNPTSDDVPLPKPQVSDLFAYATLCAQFSDTVFPAAGMVFLRPGMPEDGHGVFRGDVCEYALAKRALTNEEFGTGHEGMVRAARENGFYCYRTYAGTLSQVSDFLAKGAPVTVLMLMPEYVPGEYGVLDQLHYVVVTGMTDEAVIVHDPDNEDGKPDAEFSYRDFLSRWRSLDSADERWMMAISPEPFRIEGELAPIGSYDPVKEA